MTHRKRLVLVGNGMAGMRAIEELLKLEPELYEITVFGSEPHGNYNRILLSPVLAAEKTVADIMLNTREWYTENHITLQGERKREHEEEKGGVYRSERSYGSFYREIPLPEGAITEQAKANFKNGVLEITMPAPPEQVRRGRRLEIAEESTKK